MIERRLVDFSFYAYARERNKERERERERETERILSIAAPPFELRFVEVNIEFNEFCETPAITR